MYIIFVFFYFHVACNCSNSLSKKLNVLILYNLSIKGEKYKLDLSKFLMSWKDCFLSQLKYFDQLSHTKNKSKQKVCRSNWKISKNRGTLKHFFFKIGIHSMQGWTATRHGVTRKRNTKRFRHTWNLFRKNLQLKDVS